MHSPTCPSSFDIHKFWFMLDFPRVLVPIALSLFCPFFLCTDCFTLACPYFLGTHLSSTPSNPLLPHVHGYSLESSLFVLLPFLSLRMSADAIELLSDTLGFLVCGFSPVALLLFLPSFRLDWSAYALIFVKGYDRCIGNILKA